MTFTQILNVSISASWLVVAVLLLRLVLKRAPKALICALWALVAVRLLCPVLPESPVSLLPTVEVIPERYLMMEPGDSDGIQPILDIVSNPNYPMVVDKNMSMSVDRLQWKDLFWTLNWYVGMGVMALYALYSYLNLRLRTRVAVRFRDNIWLCDDIDSPFILGILKPRICIPSGMDMAQIPHVIAHEQAHLKRRDHWWKPLGYALLTVHWFNPVMWVAYWFLCRDIELACDERVIRDLDRSAVRAYSEALIACGTKQRFVTACPLAFGEVGVKERVKSMINYKKPGFWIILIAVLLSAVAAVCFLTNPPATTMGNIDDLEFDSAFQHPQTIHLHDGTYIYMDREQGEEIVSRLRQIELDPVPVSRSVDEDREWMYLISGTNNEGYNLCIGADFATVWTQDRYVKPSYSYAVKDPDALKDLLASYFPRVEWNALPYVGEYVSDECLYMNPLSSWYAFGGDSGFAYNFQTDYFTVTHRDSGSTVNYPVKWDWKDVRWNAEPFSRFVGNLELEISGCPALAALLSPEAQYMAVGPDQEILLISDQGRLLLVDAVELNNIGWSVWSIYRLVPEGAKGSARWEFQPASSVSYPGFRFGFDMEYTSVTAMVSGGTLISFDEPSVAGYPSGSMLEIPAGAALYWAPVDEQGNVVQEGVVRFTVMDGEKTVFAGNLYITGTELKYEVDQEMEPAVYTGKLVGSGLYLEQNEENGGGVIRSGWIFLGTATMEE